MITTMKDNFVSKFLGKDLVTKHHTFYFVYLIVPQNFYLYFLDNEVDNVLDR